MAHAGHEHAEQPAEPHAVHDEHHEHAVHEHPAGNDTHSGHSHGAPGDGWEWSEFWSLMGSAEHWAFEIVSGFVYWVFFSLIAYKGVYKTWIEPRLRASIHREIDAEHGVDHDSCEGKIDQNPALVEKDLV